MILVDSDYRDPITCKLLIDAFNHGLADERDMPIFICIGSDRHLLDCFGPMTGTMLQESLPDLIVCGNLDQPLHARNLTREIIKFKNKYANRKFIAIDAAVGEETEIGHIQFRTGPILPGRAVAKSLPAVGDFALTAIVEQRGLHRVTGQEPPKGFAHVYHMAKLTQQAVTSWYCLHQQ